MKSFAKYAILTVLAFSAATALADTNSSTPPNPTDHGTRFDVRCDFGTTGADAHARIFKSWSDENASSIQPEWGGNLLAISYRGQLVYANDAAVYIVTDNNGHSTWQIQGVNTYPLIDLGDRPFSDDHFPKTVPSILDFGNGHHAGGHCDIDRTIF